MSEQVPRLSSSSSSQASRNGGRSQPICNQRGYQQSLRKSMTRIFSTTTQRWVDSFYNCIETENSSRLLPRQERNTTPTISCSTPPTQVQEVMTRQLEAIVAELLLKSLSPSSNVLPPPIFPLPRPISGLSSLSPQERLERSWMDMGTWVDNMMATSS